MRLTEMLKQLQYQPLSLGDQVALIYAGTRGYLDNVPVDRVKEWQSAFLRSFNSQFATTANAINDTKGLPDDLEAGLKEALTTFNASWS